MIDKMKNCTADEHQNSNGPVYGDYMDDMGSTVFNEAAKLGEYKKLQVTTNLKEFHIYFS